MISLVQKLNIEIDLTLNASLNQLKISVLVNNLVELSNNLEKNKTSLQYLNYINKKGYTPLIKIHYLLNQENLANLFYALSKLKHSIADINKDINCYKASALYCIYSMKILEDVNDLFRKDTNQILSQTKQQIQNQIHNLLKTIYQDLIKISSNTSPCLLKLDQMQIDDISKKHILEKIRELSSNKIKEAIKLRSEGNVKDYVKTTKKLFCSIAKSMSNYLSELFQSAESIIGTAPCKYVVMGLGSMALKQITPYSDLEFCIVTENEDYKNYAEYRIKNYFTNLTHLVHFYNICLGETLIPENLYKVKLDKYIKSAVQFDPGGKTPLGRNDKKYELIQTADKMLSYIRDKDISNTDKNLPCILEKACYVYGEKSLIKKYNQALEKLMVEPSDKIINLTKAQYTAFEILKKGINQTEYTDYRVNNKRRVPNLEEFSPSSKVKSVPGKLFNVKQEIYRTADRFIYNLGRFLNEKGKNNWEILENLSKKNKISKEAAINLQEALSFANLLRATAYDHYKCQKESLSSIYKQSLITSLQDEQKELLEIFQLTHSEMDVDGPLFRFFYVMQELYEKLLDYCKYLQRIEGSNERLVAGKLNVELESFFNNSVVHKMQICSRLMQWHQATKLGENSLASKHTGADNYIIKNNLVSAYISLGQHSKALKYQLEILKTNQANYGENNVFITFDLNNIGHTYGKLEKFEDALEYLQKALNIRKNLSIGKSIYTAVVLNNMGYVCSKLKNYEQGLKYQLESLEIRQALIGDKPHLDIASSFHNIGSTNEKLGFYLNSLKYKLKALKIRQEILGTKHPDIAANLNNIGYTYVKFEDYYNALKYMKRALKIRKDLLDANHPDLATSFYNMGYIHGKLFNYKKSLSLLSKAAKIDKKFTNAVSLVKSRQQKFSLSVEEFNKHGKNCKALFTKPSLSMAVKKLQDSLKVFKELKHYGYTIETLKKLIHTTEIMNRGSKQLKYEKMLYSEVKKSIKIQKNLQNLHKIEKESNLLEVKQERTTKNPLTRDPFTFWRENIKENKYNNCEWYDDETIYNLLELQADNKNCRILAITQFENKSLLQENLQHALNYITFSGLPVLMPIHVHGNHWVGAVIRKQNNGNIQVIYNDPKGLSIQNEQNALDFIKIIQQHSPKANIIDLQFKQQDNDNDCGPFTVDNLLRLAKAKNIDGYNRQDIIERPILSKGGNGSSIRNKHSLLIKNMLDCGSNKENASSNTQNSENIQYYEGKVHRKKQNHNKKLVITNKNNECKSGVALNLFDLQTNDIILSQNIDYGSQNILPLKRKTLESRENVIEPPYKIIKRSSSCFNHFTGFPSNTELINLDFSQNTSSQNSTSSEELMGQDINYTQ
ncbi:MAG TPA: tetratricopeptide repeat protein [Candidatus Megaira endosymbiont of Nemacystus decipiens]|nr:tetratricopeptide repeat protein [Candidatus Megaera endosymbiont of Nemacystus decipiens]